MQLTQNLAEVVIVANIGEVNNKEGGESMKQAMSHFSPGPINGK